MGLCMHACGCMCACGYMHACGCMCAYGCMCVKTMSSISWDNSSPIFLGMLTLIFKVKFLLFKNIIHVYIYYSVCACVNVWMQVHTYHIMHVEVRRQLLKVGYLLPCRFWGWNSGSRLGSKWLYPLNYLKSNPSFPFFFLYFFLI